VEAFCSPQNENIQNIKVFPKFRESSYSTMDARKYDWESRVGNCDLLIRVNRVKL
jgi:hypothetical protein